MYHIFKDGYVHTQAINYFALRSHFLQDQNKNLFFKLFKCVRMKMLGSFVQITCVKTKQKPVAAMLVD